MVKLYCEKINESQRYITIRLTSYMCNCCHTLTEDIDLHYCRKCREYICDECNRNSSIISCFYCYKKKLHNLIKNEITKTT
jgi:hypothetical protein